MVDPSTLRRHPLLADAATPVIDLLARRALAKRWNARQVIFRRGDPPYGLVLILEGRVRVSRERDGRRQLLHIEEAGGCLGEVPVVDNHPMPATAIAAEATHAIIVSPEVLRAAVMLDPKLALKLLAGLAQRVRGLADRLERMTLHGVGMRLAAALLERAGRSRGQTLSLGMSQEQFAEELGTVREVLVRELRLLVQARILVRLGAGKFEVRRADALQAIAIGARWNPSPRQTRAPR
jgi:CRP-like cAMP-binding protein